MKVIKGFLLLFFIGVAIWYLYPIVKPKKYNTIKIIKRS